MPLTIWEILFYAWTASEILIAVLTRTRNNSNAAIQDRGSMRVLWFAIVGSMTACEWIRQTHQPNMFGGADWLKTTSVLILAAALALRWSAVFSLGRAFSANVAIRESQTIKTSGLYSLVRHPSYSGLLLIFFAVGLHSRYWLSFFIAVAPTTLALLYRIRIEEKALIQAFGQEYEAYAKHTKRLIPGVL